MIKIRLSGPAFEIEAATYEIRRFFEVVDQSDHQVNRQQGLIRRELVGRLSGGFAAYKVETGTDRVAADYS